MPVDSVQQRPYMRFLAQYKQNGKWHFLKKGGDSGWRSAYSGPFMSQEFGWTFKFDETGAVGVKQDSIVLVHVTPGRANAPDAAMFSVAVDRTGTALTVTINKIQNE